MQKAVKLCQNLSVVVTPDKKWNKLKKSKWLSSFKHKPITRPLSPILIHNFKQKSSGSLSLFLLFFLLATASLEYSIRFPVLLFLHTVVVKTMSGENVRMRMDTGENSRLYYRHCIGYFIFWNLFPYFSLQIYQ